ERVFERRLGNRITLRPRAGRAEHGRHRMRGESARGAEPCITLTHGIVSSPSLPTLVAALPSVTTTRGSAAQDDDRVLPIRFATPAPTGARFFARRGRATDGAPGASSADDRDEAWDKPPQVHHQRRASSMSPPRSLPTFVPIS